VSSCHPDLALAVTIVSCVNTRMLMILAFLTGMLIIIAFAIQLILHLT